MTMEDAVLDAVFSSNLSFFSNPETLLRIYSSDKPYNVQSITIQDGQQVDRDNNESWYYEYEFDYYRSWGKVTITVKFAVRYSFRHRCMCPVMTAAGTVVSEVSLDMDGFHQTWSS